MSGSCGSCNKCGRKNVCAVIYVMVSGSEAKVCAECATMILSTGRAEQVSDNRIEQVPSFVEAGA